MGGHPPGPSLRGSLREDPPLPQPPRSLLPHGRAHSPPPSLHPLRTLRDLSDPLDYPLQEGVSPDLSWALPPPLPPPLTPPPVSPHLAPHRPPVRLSSLPTGGPLLHRTGALGLQEGASDSRIPSPPLSDLLLGYPPPPPSPLLPGRRHLHPNHEPPLP